MFANFDDTNFPLIKVNFTENLTENNFDLFLKQWLSIYEKKEYFSIIFDTEKIKFMHPKYAIKIANFIKILKQKNPQYLLFSILVLENNFLKNILKLVMSIQKPSSPLYIINNIEESIPTYTKIIKGEKVNCTHFLPSKK